MAESGTAVEFLLAQLWAGSDGTRFRQQSNVTGAAHALGQCCTEPSQQVKVVAALDHAIQRASHALLQQREKAEQKKTLEEETLEEEQQASGLDFVSLEHRRTIAESCWALGLIGNRAMVAAAGEAGASTYYLHRAPTQSVRFNICLVCTYASCMCAELPELVAEIVRALLGVLTPFEEIGRCAPDNSTLSLCVRACVYVYV